MTRPQNRLSIAIQKILDALLSAAAFLFAYFLRKFAVPGSLGGLAEEPNYGVVIVLVVFVFPVSFSLAGLYDLHQAEGRVSLAARALRGSLIGVAAVTILLYLLKVQHISRLLMGLFLVFEVLFVTAGKVLLRRVSGHYGVGGLGDRSVLILGDRGRVGEIAAILSKGDIPGYRVEGSFIVEGSGPGEGEGGIGGEGGVEKFRATLRGAIVDDVIFASPPGRIPEVKGYIACAEQMGINVHILLDWQLQALMYQPETARMEFDSFLGLPTILLSSVPKRDAEMLVKTVADYLVAGGGLVILSPLMLLIGLMIKVTSPGPVLFRQERCGLNGRRFTLYKFRTMVDGAEEMQGDLRERNEADGPVFKIKRDPRVTVVGRFLRRTSLDELPQFVNILRGEMSVVGPRPPIPSEVEGYESWQRRRLSMKPGLTCLWQIEGRNTVTFDRWMRMDLEYIDNWSLLLDLKILYRTFFVVVRCTGS